MTDGSRAHRPGEFLKVTAITKPDPDHYAVIHMRRWAFGCGREWFETNQPAVGGYITVDPATGHRIFVPTLPPGATEAKA